MAGDFGDEFAELIMNEGKQIGRFIFDEGRSRFAARSKEQYQEDAARGKRYADSTNADYKDALKNGKNGAFDFTDGQSQAFTFDLRAFQGEDHEIAKQILEDCLKENGFEPSELVPIELNVYNPETEVTERRESGSYYFTFTDDPEQLKAFDKVTDEYYDNILSDPRIMESMGVENLHAHLADFDKIKAADRPALVNELNRVFEQKDISVVRDSEGVIQDISVMTPGGPDGKKAIQEAWNNHCLNHKIDPERFPFRLTLSTESAGVKAASLEAGNKIGAAAATKLISNGVLDAKVNIDRAGTVAAEMPLDSKNMPTFMRVKNQVTNMAKNIKASMLGTGDKGKEITRKDGPLPWRMQSNHIAKAVEHEAKIASQILDPTKTRGGR